MEAEFFLSFRNEFKILSITFMLYYLELIGLKKLEENLICIGVSIINLNKNSVAITLIYLKKYYYL